MELDLLTAYLRLTVDIEAKLKLWLLISLNLH